MLDDLVKKIELDSVSILMILLKLLNGIDLLLVFLVLVALGDLLLHLLGDLDETVVTLLHPLFLHQQLVLDLLQVLLVLRSFQNQ